MESYFCRSAVGGQPISVLVTSNAVNGKTFPAIPFWRAPATAATGRKNGTTERQNGKTECWKLGMIQLCGSSLNKTAASA